VRSLEGWGGRSDGEYCYFGYIGSVPIIQRDRQSAERHTVTLSLTILAIDVGPLFIEPLCAFAFWSDAVVVGPERTPPAAFYVFDEIQRNIGGPTRRELISVDPDRTAKIAKGYRVRFDPTSETVC